MLRKIEIVWPVVLIVYLHDALGADLFPVKSSGMYVMQLTMGTSGAETISVAGNIFVGQTESPLMVKPYLGQISNSELAAVMTGGFATIAGSVFRVYVEFGVSLAQ